MCLAVHKTTDLAHFQNEVLPPLQSVYQREYRIIPINQPGGFKPWGFQTLGISTLGISTLGILSLSGSEDIA